jgi:VanZ family protein
MKIVRWLPAIIMMIVIFGFSSIPGKDLPSFGTLDLLFKKGAHVLGYALLAFSFWYGQSFSRRNWWLALLLAVLYAITDEFHQSFVVGRHPSWVDALVIDGSGAGLGLFVCWLGIKKSEKK